MYVIFAKPPLLTLKVPVHPLPPPPVMINGNVPFVYPEPPKMEVAPVIPDVIVIVGVVIYPVPALVITKEVIIPEPTIGVITASLPPPQLIVNCVLATTYPVPPDKLDVLTRPDVILTLGGPV